jgi:hypothetical protein
MNDKKISLSDLVAELERQKNNRYDIVVPSDKIIMGYDSNLNKIYMDIPQLDGTTKQHGITEYAHEQIATKTGIPAKYYDKMIEEGKFELLSANVNGWMPSKDKRLVRVLDNDVRALLSDRYRIIDNHDILFETLQQFKKIQDGGIQIDIKESCLTDKHLYLKAVSPDISGEVMHYKGRTEPVQGGIILSNSEVGCGAYRVEPFVNVLVCQNGLIRERSFNKVHLGKERGIGLVDWSDQTLEYQDMTLWSELRDIITNTFKPEVFQEWLRKINDKAGMEIQRPEEAINVVIKNYSLPLSVKNDLINQFMRESPTVWGLSMAVTQVAQKQSNYETQIDMERVGSRILEEIVVDSK